MLLLGKAVSNWVHLRNFPLIIKGFVKNYDDSILSFALKLHEIVERLCAQELFPYEVKILEDKIVVYLNLRKEVREEYPSLMPNSKPKHHFLRKETLINTSFLSSF